MQCRAQQGELGSHGLGDSESPALIRIACPIHGRARSRVTTPVKTRADTLVHPQGPSQVLPRSQTLRALAERLGETST